MRVFKQKELLFSMSDTQPLLRTSYNQQEAGTTKEERSVLLYNNRWICLLPFARKPDPRRVSKQVSREPPQACSLAWFVPRRRPNEKRRRQANSARRRPENYAICCDLPSLLARLSLVLLSQSSASGRSLFTKDRRERAQASLHRRVH